MHCLLIMTSNKKSFCLSVIILIFFSSIITFSVFFFIVFLHPYENILLVENLFRFFFSLIFGISLPLDVPIFLYIQFDKGRQYEVFNSLIYRVDRKSFYIIYIYIYIYIYIHTCIAEENSHISMHLFPYSIHTKKRSQKMKRKLRRCANCFQ